jgi:hypothetical protein
MTKGSGCELARLPMVVMESPELRLKQGREEDFTVRREADAASTYRAHSWPTWGLQKPSLGKQHEELMLPPQPRRVNATSPILHACLLNKTHLSATPRKCSNGTTSQAGQEYVQKQQLHITSRQQGLSSHDEGKEKEGGNATRYHPPPRGYRRGWQFILILHGSS